MNIHHLQISHNAPPSLSPPPPKKIHTHCFQFLLGRLKCDLGEMKNKGYAKFGRGVNKVHYWRCTSGVLHMIKAYKIGFCYFHRLLLFVTRPLFWLAGDSQKQIPRAKSHKWACLQTEILEFLILSWYRDLSCTSHSESWDSNTVWCSVAESHTWNTDHLVFLDKNSSKAKT